MPEYHLDTEGRVPVPCPVSWAPDAESIVTWADLDSFTQGYITAAFFTENAPGVTTEEWQATEDHDEGSIPGDVGFDDLDGDTLAEIIADCQAFQTGEAYSAFCKAAGDRTDWPDHAHAGRDFWYTRNGHGCGFWDGDWPEPHATALTNAAKAVGEYDLYLGDDGKVHG